MTPEGKVKALVKKAFDTLPRRYRHMPVVGGLGAPSIDFICCVNGHYVGVETKRPGGKVTGRQDRTIQDIRAAGGLVFVVDGQETLDAMMRTLRDL